MIGFQKTYPVERRFDGREEEGAYVEGLTTELSISANVQPLDAARELSLLPVGADIGDTIVILSETKLESRGQEGKPADYLKWRNELYEIVSEADFTDSPMPHYRYIGVKE